MSKTTGSKLFKKGITKYIFGGICSILALYFLSEGAHDVGEDAGIREGCYGEAEMISACILRKYGKEEGRDIINKVNGALNEELPNVEKELKK